MKIVNLNAASNIRFTLFPDNQPHVNLENIEPGDEVKVVCAITDSLKMIQLLLAASAADNIGAKKKVLVIPYLMAARYDRLMLPGDSFDLKVIAHLINSMLFEKVYLLDVHSEVALELINNAANITNRPLVEKYKQENAVLICPDKGVVRKIKEYQEWNSQLIEVVYCTKSRDLATGKITLQVQEPEKCTGRNCVIIDDICDGGGTFLSIAEQLQPAHLTLIVTHGIFSKGFTALEKYFNEVIVSNSLCKNYDSKIISINTIDYENIPCP